MYVCICNALNETRIATALASGAGTVGAVYQACGVTPRCGKCGEGIRARLAERRAAMVLAPHQSGPAEMLAAAE